MKNPHWQTLRLFVSVGHRKIALDVFHLFQLIEGELLWILKSGVAATMKQ